MNSSNSSKVKGRREPMNAFEYSGSGTPTQASGKSEISSVENQFTTCKLQLITFENDTFRKHSADRY